MIKWASKKVEERAQKLNKVLFGILVEMGNYCQARGYDLVVTSSVSTKQEDQVLGRVSSSHREGRAVDLRTRDWPQMFLDSFIYDFSGKYGDIGAVSSTDGKRRFIVDKSKKSQPHIHVQLSREYAVDTKE
jgi:hypothetical protein